MKAVTTTAILMILSLVFSAPLIRAQTTAFTYQGRLTSNSANANGSYDFQFTLFDALTAGTQVGTLSKANVTVAGGAFTVTLDFGAAAFPGAGRWLEISAKKSTDSTFTLLTPRQQIGPSPYAIRAQSASAADTATNATQLGGVAASQYVTTTNGPTNFIQNQSASPQTGGFNISGNGAIGGNLTVIGTLTATLPSGSTKYIQNSTSQQATSNFNISGNGTVGGTVSASQFNSGGNRVLFADSSLGNTFGGPDAGINNSTAFNNTFFGSDAGRSSQSGGNNAFFGTAAGLQSVSTMNNVFVGNAAGAANTANENTFVGAAAGLSNTGGTQNSFFGRHAGQNNTTGQGNVFLGFAAGTGNTTENNNTLIGANANLSSGLTNSTAIGANALVTTSNALVLGPISINVGIGTTAPGFKLHVADSAFPTLKIDGSAANGAGIQLNNTSTGGHNWSIFSTGSGNSEGVGNLVLSDASGGGHVVIKNGLTTLGTLTASAGLTASGGLGVTGGLTGDTITGNTITANTQYNIGSNRVLAVGNTSLNNTFVGVSAGAANTTGSSNVFFGTNAGKANTDGSMNSFFGSGAGKANTSGVSNLFVGARAGEANTNGVANVIVGTEAGELNTTGSGNTFLGASAGPTNRTGDNNTYIGSFAGGTSALSNATAIGANASVTISNSLVLGDPNVNVGIGTTGPGFKLHISDSNFPTMRIDGSNTVGTWLQLNNTGGGHTWSLISSGSGNGEGAGNLVIGDSGSGGHITMGNPLVVPSCTGCTTVTSDRNVKTNFAALDTRSVLERLVGIPIQTWNYNSDPKTVRHIGPMAQDFFAAFGIGTDDKHINLIDEGGVALAAIQELYKANQAKEKQIDELTKRITELEKMIGKLTKEK